MTKARARFAIVIPSFNAAETIEETINSILVQDHPSIDIFVIDGASTDGTVEILKSFDGQIQWLSEPDKGQTNAINKGMRLVDADIVKWLNADDRLLPQTLAKVDAYFQRHPDVDFVYGDIQFVDGKGQVIGTHREPSFSKFVLIYGHNLFADPACFWRHDLFQDVGELDERMDFSMDYEFWARSADSGKRFGQIPEFLAQFRITGRNISLNNLDALRLEHFSVVVERRKFFKWLPESIAVLLLRGLMLTARALKVVLVLVQRGPQKLGSFSNAARR